MDSLRYSGVSVDLDDDLEDSAVQLKLFIEIRNVM